MGRTTSSVSAVIRNRAQARAEHAGRRVCGTCAHLGARLTCLEPVRAGLVATFGIAFVEPGDGARCVAWQGWQDEAGGDVLAPAGG